jgi:hypothetical protein
MKEEDYDETPELGVELAQSITELARLQYRQEQEVTRIQLLLKEAEKALNKTSHVDLPDAMASAGLETMTLTGGYVVSVKSGISVSVAGDKKGPALSWLEESGHGDIVTLDLLVTFGLDSAERAKDASDLLLEAGYASCVKRDVNTARLKALVAELLEKGEELPLDTLGVYKFKKSVIQPPKKVN